MQVRGPTARLLGLLVGLLLLFASSSSLELEGAPLLEGEGIPEGKKNLHTFPLSRATFL